MGFGIFRYRSGRGCPILEPLSSLCPDDGFCGLLDSVHGVTVLPDRARNQNEIEDPGVPGGHDRAIFFAEKCIVSSEKRDVATGKLANRPMTEVG